MAYAPCHPTRLDLNCPRCRLHAQGQLCACGRQKSRRQSVCEDCRALPRPRASELGKPSKPGRHAGPVYFWRCPRCGGVTHELQHVAHKQCPSCHHSAPSEEPLP